MKKFIAILMLLCLASAHAEGGASAPGIFTSLRESCEQIFMEIRETVSGLVDGRDGGTPGGVYNVVARDQDGQPVPGVAVTFCDVTCQRYVTDAQGVISFTGAPARYSLKIAGAPEGYGWDADFDAGCDGSGEWVVVPVVRE